MTVGGRRPRAILRDRLHGAARERARVCLVVAPAGHGKSTLLSHLAAAAPAPGVSLNARDWDGRVAGARRDSFLALDDVHLLRGDTARRLGELMERGPRNLTLLLAGRRPPDANLSRLQASGELTVLGPDDLRFRSWEVEQLFREVYDAPLAPEEVVDLARRTGGWAACLHLFHVATAGRLRQRRELLATLPRGGRLIHEYLTANVLDDLPGDLRAFLVRTSVLATLTPALCDLLLRTEGSRAVLEELAARRLVRDAGRERWRCDPVLRVHLHAVLREDSGAAPLFVAAGEAAERAGAAGDAFEAYVNAGEWGAANRLLATHGDGALEHAAAVEALGEDLGSSPWVLTAVARRLRAAGRATEARAAYARAEAAFGAGAGAAAARSERVSLTAWVEPLQEPPGDWAGALRSALTSVPVDPARCTGGSANGVLARALAALVCGRVRRSLEQLEEVAADPRASEATAAAAGVATAVALGLGGDASARAACEAAAEEAEAAGLPWLVEVARAALALDGAAPDAAGPADPVGRALAALFRALGELRAGSDPRPALAAAAEGAGLRPLAVWAHAVAALAAARAGDPSARSAALHAESASRRVGAEGARAYALLACAEATGDAAQTRAAVEVAADLGLALPLRPRAQRVLVRCFGGLALEIDGETATLDELRPRARRLFRYLLLRAPQPVHREVLTEALWPHLPPRRAASSLHVALTALRHALDDAGGPSIRRDGDAYAVEAGSAEIDLVAFRAATVRGAGAAALETALDLYGGDVFPEDGPAEWIVEERELLREQAVRAAQRLAERALSDDPRRAAAACERGLELDRQADPLWRLLVEAYERAGNPAAARRAAERYDGVLRDLGIALGAR